MGHHQHHAVTPMVLTETAYPCSKRRYHRDRNAATLTSTIEPRQARILLTFVELTVQQGSCRTAVLHQILRSANYKLRHCLRTPHPMDSRDSLCCSRTWNS